MKYLRVIRDESGRLAELSQNMLFLSKVEATQIVTGKAAFDLSEQNGKVRKSDRYPPYLHIYVTTKPQKGKAGA